MLNICITIVQAILDEMSKFSPVGSSDVDSVDVRIPEVVVVAHETGEGRWR